MAGQQATIKVDQIFNCRRKLRNCSLAAGVTQTFLPNCVDSDNSDIDVTLESNVTNGYN